MTEWGRGRFWANYRDEEGAGDHEHGIQTRGTHGITKFNGGVKLNIMEWFKFPTKTTGAPEYAHAKPAAKLAWLRVLCYCAQQENGGLIPDAAGWSDGQWIEVCGVRKRDVMDAEPLLTAVGGHITVWGYPQESQFQKVAASEAGKAAATARWRKVREDAAGDAARIAPGNADGNPASNAGADAVRNAEQKEGTEGSEGLEKREGGGIANAPARPRLPEILEYAEAQGIREDWAQAFFDHYEGNGWRVGGLPINSWQARLRKWVREEPKRARGKNGGPEVVVPLHGPNYLTGGYPVFTPPAEPTSDEPKRDGADGTTSSPEANVGETPALPTATTDPGGDTTVPDRT